MMFFADRQQATREMLRVLVPGGRMAIAVWAGLPDNPVFAAEVELFERLGGRAAANALRAPFVMAERDELHDLLQQAGADAIEVATAHEKAHFPSIRSLVEADLRGWLPLMGVTLGEEQVAEILTEADGALARFSTTPSAFQFEVAAHVATAAKKR
jgi:SAM-dependent methyltransferase